MRPRAAVVQARAARAHCFSVPDDMYSVMKTIGLLGDSSSKQSMNARMCLCCTFFSSSTSCAIARFSLSPMRSMTTWHHAISFPSSSS